MQPAASAGAALRVIMALGKFQGVIAAQTPTGCLNTIQPLSVSARRDDVAVDPLRLLGEPLDEAGAVGDLAAQLGERLALLAGHDDREVLLVRHHQIEPLAEDPARSLAVVLLQVGRRARPPRSRAGSRPHPARHRAEPLARGGIETSLVLRRCRLTQAPSM